MYRKFFKRLIDIILSLIALPFVLLAIAIMAPFIYFEDKGPVFYNAERRGMNGKSFRMFKLRSMYVNSPDIKIADGSTYNSANDPRVTKIGKFMRKTSVDELPQIINVLIGDMSFIGPRPTLVTMPYEELPEINKKRLQMRPGVTGYAQAYYRNSISKQKKYEYDCFYIDNASFILDIKIILQTIKSVLMQENIYVTTEESPAAEETRQHAESK